MKTERTLLIPVSLFTAALVCSNLLGSKLVLIGGVTLSVGIFIFPLTFLMVDVISEIHGRKMANDTVKVGLAIQLLVLGLVYLGDVLPASPRRDLTEAYRQVFSLTPRMIFASFVAYTVSEFLDVFVFLKFKQKLSGKFLALRMNLASLISQFVDTAVFVALFLGGVLPVSELIDTFLVNYLVKILIAAVDSPAVIFLVRLLNRDSRAAQEHCA